jgi:cell wall assembly regulator SMI1
LDARTPATDTALASAEREIGAKLPGQYLDFLKTRNGEEGFVGPNSYVMLWGAEELASLNEVYEVQKYAPGLLLFGSDGGGEAYGFDTRTPEWQIVQIPFVGMTWDLARPLAKSFDEFLLRLAEPVLDG